MRKLQRKPKVLLTIPNQAWGGDAVWSIHPYSMCALIAILRQYGCEADLLDANVDALSKEETRSRISEYRPDIVGVSVLSDSYREAGFTMSRLAKQTVPRCTVIMGGVFVTTRPKKAMLCPEVDYGVVGEGEHVLVELLDYLTGKVDKLPSEGIAFRENGEIRIRPQKTFITDLDALPMPDYSVIDYSKYSMGFRKEVNAPRALPYGKLITSRGCPVGCCFCEVQHIAGRKVRSTSARRVIDEIQILVEEHGIKSLEFLDDQLLVPKKRFLEILRMLIEKDWDLVWNAHNVSVFYLDEELLDLMKASKCQFTSLAVESGSPRVLREIIKKPVDIEHSMRMAEYCQKIGMDTCALFVIGFPGETWNEIRQTIRVAGEIATDYVKINIAVPFPGTPLFDMAVEAGAIHPDVDFDTLSWGKAIMSTDEFTADQLQILRAMEWDRINFTDPERRDKIAKMMGITPEELDLIRRKTINLHLS